MPDKFSFTEALLAEVAKWGVPLVGGLVAVFFTPLVEAIKLRLNKVELRVKQYEEFAKDLSTFIFEAELQHEFLSATWATTESLNEITESYNAAITSLRAKEIVYLSWAERYWGSDHLLAFQTVLSLVRQVDKAVHQFNDGQITPNRLLSLHSRTQELREATLELLAPKRPCTSKAPF
jgi:hypothetical protein